MSLAADPAGTAPPARPPVSLIVPFAGSADEIASALEVLMRIRRDPGDELIVVDNTGADTVPERPGVRIVTAQRESSAYYARNEGTAAARHPWLLFLDADCHPRPDLLERYFAAPVPDEVGALIGEVVGLAEQSALVSRYARSRGHLSQDVHWRSSFRPWGVTANLLVRRDAWTSVGGFQEGIRSGGDTEFSWRLQDAGWRLDYRPQAVVEHAHRETIGRLARQAGRYGAGRAWVMRRYPSSFERPTLLRRLARCVLGVAVWTASLQFERATFKALDAVYIISEWSAFWLLSNAPPRSAKPAAATIGLVTGAFPELDPETPRTVDAVGATVRVEATSRPVRVDRECSRRVPIGYAEDDGGLRRAYSVLALIVLAPLSVVRHPREAIELAPAAIRLRRAGVRSLRALDDSPSTRRRAKALALLLGLRAG